MKIAFFLDIPNGLGGAGNLLLQQAILMSELHDVMVIIPTDNEGNYNIEYANRCKKNKMEFLCLRYNTTFNFSSIDFTESMKNVKYIEEFAIREDIDFFHSVQLNITVEYLSRKLKIPHLMDIYQLNEEEFILCQGDIYPHYHLCDSILYSERWKRKLGIESRCIRPIGIVNKIQKKEYVRNKKIEILMLGSVCPRKNQMAAIKVIEQIIGLHDIELHIAGDLNNDYGYKCRQYVENQNLDKAVVFHGFVSEITSLLKQCDCLLCTSLDESFPSSIVEAVSYDLTIISTPVAGVPEIFVDRYNSFISKDFSLQSIYESVLECLNFYRNGKIVDIHMNAEKTWERNFNRDTIRKEIDAFYHFIMSEKKFQSYQCFHKIENLIERIKSLLSCLDDEGENWIHTRFFYYLSIKKYLCRGSIYIWGAGIRGKLTYEILRLICPKARVLAFIDTYKCGEYLGLPIIKIENADFVKSNFWCISFADNNDFAVQYLENKGLQINRQVWHMP